MIEAWYKGDRESAKGMCEDVGAGMVRERSGVEVEGVNRARLLTGASIPSDWSERRRP